MADTILNNPNECATKQQYLEEIIRGTKTLQDVPAGLIDVEFVIEAMKRSGESILSHLPKECRNNDFYFQLVKGKPEIIWKLPKKHLTARICKDAIKSMGYSSTAAAVKENPRLLSHLHTSLYDHETSLNFLNSEFFRNSQTPGTYGFDSISDRDNGLFYLNRDHDEKYSLPALMQWEDTLVPLLKMFGGALAFARKSAITEDICKSVIEQNAFALQDVPIEHRTQSLCDLAFEKEPLVIEFIPDQYKNYDMAYRAVSTSGDLLEYIPRALRTKELCLIAVTTHFPVAFREIPTSVLDKEMILAAFSLKGGDCYNNTLAHLPDGIIDYDICKAAVQSGYSDLSDVPEEYKSYELCLLAVRSGHCRSLDLIPKKHMTEELLLSAVSKRPLFFDDVPGELLTEKVCLQALTVAENIGQMGRIANRFVTEKTAEVFVERNGGTLHGIPIQYINDSMLRYVAKNHPDKLCDNYLFGLNRQAFFARVQKACEGQNIELDLDQYTSNC